MSFDQSSACQSAFDSLKKIITKAPILIYQKQGVKTIIETDSLNNTHTIVFS